jgi:hypothetical protein
VPMESTVTATVKPAARRGRSEGYEPYSRCSIEQSLIWLCNIFRHLFSPSMYVPLLLLVMISNSRQPLLMISNADYWGLSLIILVGVVSYY